MNTQLQTPRQILNVNSNKYDFTIQLQLTLTMENNSTTDLKIENWFLQLEQNSILKKTFRNEKFYYHLNSPLQFVYPENQVDNLRNGYHPKNEEGGYILFKHSLNDKGLILKAVDIKWIENKSGDPENSYRINTEDHKRIEREAYASHLFPIRFHTHPMDVTDITEQSRRRLEIIDTSDPDKRISFDFPFEIQNRTIILPDALIVWDINHLDSFFIGMYNGLISPIGFLSQRIRVTEEFNRKVKNDIVEWADEKSDWVKGALIVGSFVTLIAAICKPHISGPILNEIKNQKPLLAIGVQKENIYFGFANTKLFSEFIIAIPEVTKTIIDDNEQEIKLVMERLRLEQMKLKNK